VARPSPPPLRLDHPRRRRCYPRLIDDHPPNTAHRQCFSSFETRNTGQYRDSGALFLHRSPISILIFVSRSVFLFRHRFKFPTASRSQTALSKIVVAQNRTYTSQTFRVLGHCANVDCESTYKILKHYSKCTLEDHAGALTAFYITIYM